MRNDRKKESQIRRVREPHYWWSVFFEEFQLRELLCRGFEDDGCLPGIQSSKKKSSKGREPVSKFSDKEIEIAFDASPESSLPKCVAERAFEGNFEQNHHPGYGPWLWAIEGEGARDWWVQTLGPNRTSHHTYNTFTAPKNLTTTTIPREVHIPPIPSRVQWHIHKKKIPMHDERINGWFWRV